MEPWIQTLLTILGSIAASSGFWVFVQKKFDQKDAITEMLIGLGHDRIISLGMIYINRKSITQDEYENLYNYLYKPYEKLGGNGSAARIMAEINKLPIKNNSDS